MQIIVNIAQIRDERTIRSMSAYIDNVYVDESVAPTTCEETSQQLQSH